MFKIIRAALVALLAVCLAAVGTVSAHASPPKPTPQSASSWERLKAGGMTWDAIKRSRNVYLATGDNVLAWSTIKSKFAGSPHPTNWPRQFSAGWLHSGGSITGMPSADRSAAIHIMNETWGIGPHAVTPMKSNCRGVTKHTTSGGVDRYYFNSCASTGIKYGTAACIPLVGFIAGTPPKGWGSAIIGGIMMVGCLIVSSRVAVAQSNSSLSAIIIETRDMGWNPTPPGNEYIDVRVVSQ